MGDSDDRQNDHDSILQESVVQRLRDALAGFSVGGTAAALELGCGRGAQLAALAQQVQAGGLVIGLDRDRRRLAAAGGPLICADATALPFAAASLDLIWAIAVIGLIDDQAALWQELTRVVRPGGRLVIAAAVQRWVRIRRVPAQLRLPAQLPQEPADGLLDGIAGGLPAGWQLLGGCALLIDEAAAAAVLADETALAAAIGCEPSAITIEEPEIRPLVLVAAVQRDAAGVTVISAPTASSPGDSTRA